MNAARFAGLVKGKRSIWTLRETLNLAKHPQFCQFCQAKPFGKNGKIGKIGEFRPDDDVYTFEVPE
jgi:hypothetical protein